MFDNRLILRYVSKARLQACAKPDVTWRNIIMNIAAIISPPVPKTPISTSNRDIKPDQE